MTEISELLERGKAAKGSDRELDIALAQAFYTTETYRISDDGECEELADGWGDAFGMTGWFPTHQEIPRFTASIDAALALVERVLPPDTIVVMKQHASGKYFHVEMETDEGDFTAYNHPSMPLAILAALLTALQETQK